MKKVIIGGLLAGVVVMLMGMVFGALSADMYKMSPKILWKPMGGNWFWEMAIFDFITGFVLAWVFSVIKKSLPGEGIIKGMSFGGLTWLAGPFLGLTMTYLTMAIRTKLIAVWALNNLVNYVLSGIIFEVIDEKIS